MTAVIKIAGSGIITMELYNLVQWTDTSVESHACGSPYKGNDTFSDHGSKKYPPAWLFIGNTGRHQR